MSNNDPKQYPKIILVIPLSGVAFWESLVEELKKYGYDVVVLTQLSDMEYRKKGSLFRSMWIRFRIWVLFPLQVVVSCLSKPSFWRSILLVPTTPLYLPALASFSRIIGIRVVHLLYDLYPDQLILAGKIRKQSFAVQILSMITRSAMTRCNATIFLGERLKTMAELKYGSPKLGRIIEVGGDGSLFPKEPVREDTRKIRLLYSGNFGYAHEYQTLVALMNEPLPEGINISFHANGISYETMKAQISILPSKSQVTLGGALKMPEWQAAMESADVGIVTMKRGAEDILFPSKTYSAMLSGQAILAICAQESDLATTVKEAKAGWVIEPGDVVGLRKLLDEFVAKPGMVFDARINARKYAKEHFDMPKIAEKWDDLLHLLAAAPN